MGCILLLLLQNSRNVAVVQSQRFVRAVHNVLTLPPPRGLSQCYEQILRLDPEHVQGLHNLCVVHVKRDDLVRAQECLERAARLAPNEDYIQRHLQIVRARRQAAKTGTKRSEPGS